MCSVPYIVLSVHEELAKYLLGKAKRYFRDRLVVYFPGNLLN